MFSQAYALYALKRKENLIARYWKAFSMIKFLFLRRKPALFNLVVWLIKIQLHTANYQK